MLFGHITIPCIVDCELVISRRTRHRAVRFWWNPIRIVSMTLLCQNLYGFSLLCKYYNPNYSITNDTTKLYRIQTKRNWNTPSDFGLHRHRFGSVLVGVGMEEIVVEGNRKRFRWNEIRHEITEEQKQAISKLPFKMVKRCKAVMRQIICFSEEKGKLCDVLGAWVKIMMPTRADWLSVLKELKNIDHPLYLEVAEHALIEESFEPNLRDYTKLIHYYSKENQLEAAENIFTLMKQRGFICDQVILTTMVHMYSKAGHLDRAEEYFEEIKLLGEPLDKRSYGSMIMANIRAGMPEKGESLLEEMDAQEIYAGSEVYKALLRAYSGIGNAEGAQRIFDAIQLAGIIPDDKMCSLLIYTYGMAGQSQKARIAFENMKRVGIEPTDRCISSVLVAYEKENMLNTALEFLMDLEKDGIMVEEEASRILAGWFRKLGVVEEVELVLRDFATTTSHQRS